MSEIVKYAIAGVVNTIVGYAVFWIALRWMGLDPAVANTIGYTIALLVSFVLNKLYVFSNSRPVAHAAWRFIVAFCIAFSINQLVLFIFLKTLLMSPEIAQIFAMTSYTVVFYFLSKHFVFCNTTTAPTR